MSGTIERRGRKRACINTNVVAISNAQVGRNGFKELVC